MLIYLMGYMGSGKTSLGKKLARKLQYDFADLDSLIEQRAKRNIPQIFAEEGEEAFRKLEQAELRRSFEFNNTVVALGGGTPCFFDNLEQINKHGISVYLKLSAVSLAHRLNDSKTKRPLIEGLSEGELFEYVQQQLGEREKFYIRAHLIVKGEDLRIDQLVEDLSVFDVHLR
jgi:shikimate kinase